MVRRARMPGNIFARVRTALEAPVSSLAMLRSRFGYLVPFGLTRRTESLSIQVLRVQSKYPVYPNGSYVLAQIDTDCYLTGFAVPGRLVLMHVIRYQRVQHAFDSLFYRVLMNSFRDLEDRCL